MPRVKEGVAPSRKGAQGQRNRCSAPRAARLAASSPLIHPRPRGLPLLVPGTPSPSDEAPDPDAAPGHDPDAITLDLARSLATTGIATIADWRRAGQQPWTLLQQVLASWVESHGAAEIAQQFSLETKLVASLRDHYGYCWGNSAKPLDRAVYLIVEAEQTGYSELGPAIRRLHAAQPALPATFYRYFADSVSRWVRVFDYRDAEERVERDREYDESTMGEEELAEVEYPDLSSCVPPWLKGEPLDERRLTRVLRSVSDPTVTALMQAARRVRRCSDQAEPRSYWCEELRGFDLAFPLPALLLVTDKRDEIEGLYERETDELYNWGIPMAPSAIFRMDPSDANSVADAFRSLGILCTTLTEASRLISMLDTIAATGTHA